MDTLIPPLHFRYNRYSRVLWPIHCPTIAATVCTRAQVRIESALVARFSLADPQKDLLGVDRDRLNLDEDTEGELGDLISGRGQSAFSARSGRGTHLDTGAGGLVGGEEVGVDGVDLREELRGQLAVRGSEGGKKRTLAKSPRDWRTGKVVRR